MSRETDYYPYDSDGFHKVDMDRHLRCTHLITLINDGGYYRYYCTGHCCARMWIQFDSADPKQDQLCASLWIKKAERTDVESPPRKRR